MPSQTVKCYDEGPTHSAFHVTFPPQLKTKGSEASFLLVLSLNITLIHPHKVPRRHRKRKLSTGFASLGVTESLTTPV